MTDLPKTKWICEYCTYENWPASKKCTLCRASKPPQLITEDAPPPVDQDIYKMASLVTPPSPPPRGVEEVNKPQTLSIEASSSRQSQEIVPSSSTTLASGKWSCQLCTYLNWPRSQKCIQCLTTRQKVIPSSVSSSPSPTPDRSSPLSINVNIEGAGSASKISPKTSPRTSPNSPEAAKAINNDKNKVVGVIDPKQCKWTCRACTYENWPKSQKCVICATSRGKLSPDSRRTGSPDIIGEPPSAGGGESSDEGGSGRNSSQRMRNSPSTSRGMSDSMEILQLGGATAAPNIYQEKQERNKPDDRKLVSLRNRMCDRDWLWLNACQGVVEGNGVAVEAYLASGGDPARMLSQEEASLLNRPSAFHSGYTLVHLAIRFHREDMLAVLLTATDMAAKGKKKVPSHISPDLAADILRGIATSLRQRKGDFPCYFLTDLATFALPAEIEDLPRPVQKQMFDELLDRDVQKELEVEEPIINWSLEVTSRLGSRLYALWNRTAGDCLLDSVLQATWGVFDRDNTLRRALADSLMDGANLFYPRWKETEAMQAQSMHFSLDENQWQHDWAIILSIASQPGASLEQIHIFALAHILRRPVIVYGIKFVKSFRGENIGIARFQGVYLPLLWETSFCWKSPIALGYTRGHFSALVPMEIDTEEGAGAGANLDTNEDSQVVYLPLTDCHGKRLPIHFLTVSEMGREESLLQQWLDCAVTDSGLLVARMKIDKRPLTVRQMMDEWLDRYRRLAHLMQTRQASRPTSTLSSDEDTDDE